MEIGTNVKCFLMKYCYIISYRFCAGFLSFVFIYFAVGVFNYKEGVGNPLKGKSPPHCSACPNTGHGFPTLYVLINFYVQWFEMMTVCFVDYDNGMLWQMWCMFPGWNGDLIGSWCCTLTNAFYLIINAKSTTRR
jgi:hypothetical protein